MNEHSGEHTESPNDANVAPEKLPPSALQDLHPAIVDFTRAGVTQAITDITSKISVDHSTRFSNAAKALRKSGDKFSANAAEFLACIMQSMIVASDVT